MGNKQDKPKKKADKTVLTDEEIQYLLKQTNYTRPQIIEWHNGFLKDCPKGEITKSKFIELYQEFYPNGKVDKYATLVFNAYDSDHSGTIDFVEFLVSLSIKTETDTKRKLKFAFNMYDVNRNGTISPDEMKKFIVAIYDLLGEKDRKGRNAPAERVKEIMEKLDANKDGHLTQEEFIEGLLKDPILMSILVPIL